MSILAIPEGNAEREAFWIEAVKRWQASGADCMAAFCQREGLRKRQTNLIYRFPI